MIAMSAFHTEATVAQFCHYSLSNMKLQLGHTCIRMHASTHEFVHVQWDSYVLTYILL